MADDPFAALAPQEVPEAEVKAMKGEPMKAPEPITLPQRLALTLLFDTQPQRRAAYLKKLGYEMDPKDDNKYRPIGSKEKFLREIDPLGGVDTSLKDYFREAAADAIEAAAGLGQGAAEASAGVAGAAVGNVPGMYAGRSLAYNILEKGKDTLGDLLLDSNVPPDYALRAAQTAYGALLPEAIQGGAKLSYDKVIKPALSGITDGVRKLYKFGGGNISDTVWNALKKDWKLLSDDNALKTAGDSIDDTIERIYGMDKGSKELPKRIEPGSLFQEKLNQLEPLRRAEASKLSSLGEASISREEALQPFLEAKARIEQKPLLSDTVDEPALRWINDKIAQIQKGAAQVFTFGEADDIVKTLQKDAYKGDEPWRTKYVQGLVEDINGLLKGKAEALGSPYAQIKNQESQVFDAFAKARKAINKDTARGLIVGGLPTGVDRADINTKALNEAVDALEGAGVVPGLREGLQKDQIAHQIFKVMESSGRPRGSGGVLQTAASIGAAVGGALATNPVTRPVAIPAGLAAAGISGAALVPSIGLPIAGTAENLSQRLGQSISQGASDFSSQAIRQALSQEAASQLAQPQQDASPATVQEDDDPFKDL